MKKLRLILCFVFILSLCFGGCSTPAQNSSGDSFGKDSSKQEESSQPKEDSKTEVSSKPEESSEAENSSKVDIISKTEESSKDESSSVSEQSSAAQESSAKEESSKPEESSPAEESSQSADAGWASAYLEAIEELTAEYGEGRVENGCFAGLVLVQLIDFDGDGQVELYCAGAPGENMMIDGYVYSYDGTSSQFLASIGVGNSNKSTPLSVHKKKDGITYIMMKDGAQDHLFTLKNGAFIETDMISHTRSCWNDESMTPEALQEKIDSYETILYIDYSTPDQYDGPNLLADTQKTIESLQELAK